MRYLISDVSAGEAELLADLRIAAMKESLVAIGRFEPQRARGRFMETFCPGLTKKILVDGVLAGFYVVTPKEDCLYLDHLYIHPDCQGGNIGGSVLQRIIRLAESQCLPVRLGALRSSRSNNFYQSHGFVKTHEDEWDIYYEYITSS